MGLFDFLRRWIAPGAGPERPDQAYQAPHDVIVHSDEQLGAVEDLLRLINPTAELAQQQIEQWRDFLQRNAGQPSMGILWDLLEFADWTCTFRIDWKDTDSALDARTELASRWGVELRRDGGATALADIPAQATVADVLRVAYRELDAFGLMLWQWDTGWDDYCGWISQRDATAEMAALATRLGARVRPCDQVDQEWPPETPAALHWSER